MDYEMSFGTWLRQKIVEKGTNQRQLALRIGASTGMMSGWVHDRRRPEPDNVARLAQALGVPEEEALVRAGYRRRKDTDLDPVRAELIEMARQLPLSEAAAVIDFMRWRQAEALRPRSIRPATRQSAG